MSQESERVDELEQRVKELEATVRGLTEELVEANERIRELEDEHDLLDATGVEGRGANAGDARARQVAEDEPEQTREGQETEPADGDAQAAESADDEAPKNDDAQDREEDEDSELDDIIVA